MIARLELIQLVRALADRLHDKRNGAALDVRVRNRERNPFAAIAGPDDDELARPALAGNGRRVNPEAHDVGCKPFLSEDEGHVGALP